MDEWIAQNENSADTPAVESVESAGPLSSPISSRSIYFRWIYLSLTVDLVADEIQGEIQDFFRIISIEVCLDLTRPLWSNFAIIEIKIARSAVNLSMQFFRNLCYWHEPVFTSVDITYSVAKLEKYIEARNIRGNWRMHVARQGLRKNTER